MPFEPMVEALRTVLRTVSSEARRRVAAERGLLALLLPELDQLVPEARPERPDPSVERYLLFETVAELLARESCEHPLLIVLDDLQWADAPSLKMIEHVLRHELPGRVMVVATVRVAGRRPDAGARPGRRRRSARDGLLTRLAVGALATDAIGELLRLHGRDAAGAAELRAATGGNAFFLTELIRHADGDARRRSSRVDPGDARRCASIGSTPSSCRSSTWPPSPARRPRCRCSSPPAGSTAIACSTPPTPRSPPACWSRTAPAAWRCRTR